MSTLFISDLHLTPERPKIIQLFADFLQDSVTPDDTLYILGDLFEVWIGDDFVPPGLDTVVTKLKEISERGSPIYVMHGNRDFLLGEEFEKQSGCSLLPDHTVIDLNGTPTLLMHGDLLCTDDIDYQQFRHMVRNAQWQQQFLSKPVAERIAMAQDARKESQNKTQQLDNEIMDVNQDTVTHTMTEWNIFQLIHGHTHRPNTHQFKINNNPATRIVLGDWYEQGSVLKCNEQGCDLQTLAIR